MIVHISKNKQIYNYHIIITQKTQATIEHSNYPDTV